MTLNIKNQVQESKKKHKWLIDKEEIYYSEWNANGDNIVFLMHGIEGHAGWFEGFSKEMVRKGYHTFCLDNPGSGLNREGYLADYRKLLDVHHRFIKKIKTEYKPQKTYLIGLSLGGKLALCYTMRYQAETDGLILISPSIRNKLSFSLKDMIVLVISSCFFPKRKIELPIEAEMITRKEKYVDLIKEDPLRLKEVTAEFLLEIVKMGWFIRRNLERIMIPTLVLLAGDDEIVDNTFSRRLFKKTKFKTKEYEGLCHNLCFEDASNIVSDIDLWISTVRND